MKKTNKAKEVKIKLILSALFIGLFVVVCIFPSYFEKVFGLTKTYRKHQTNLENIENSDYYVSYINVGQGNSCYIKLPDGKTALIDGGDIEYGETVANFLTNHNTTVIDYLIATHADSDHIGGLNYVLENFEVKNIYRPFQIAGDGTTAETFEVDDNEDLASAYAYLNGYYNGKSKIARVTTNVYKQFIYNIYHETYFDGLENIKSTVTVFYDGLKITGNNYEFEFFGPLVRDVGGSPYSLSINSESTLGFATEGYGVSETNSGSAIFLFSCFNDYYLFTGDAPFSSSSTQTAYEEIDFINSLTPDEKILLSKVSVFLVGHHGSKYSTSQELLELVKPKFIVISVGAYNSYGHPADETLNRIRNIDSLESDYLARTDINGTIEFASIDGEICYCLEIQEKQNKLIISVQALSAILSGFCIIIVFSMKFNKNI